MNAKFLFRSLLMLLLLLPCSELRAQEEQPRLVNTFRLETRFDYDLNGWDDGRDMTGGFQGKYLNLVLAGNITKDFSYSYRQRILPNAGQKSFFDGTDWIYLTYNFNNRFAISAGKQVFLVGGFEYDQAPIDVYFWSDYWNNVRCYEMGASVSYMDKAGKNTLTFQFANSNYSPTTFSNLYAYNLIWYGNFNHFQTIYSVNMVEYAKGRFISYIALGNKFTFGDFSFFVDLMNRGTTRQKNFFFDDFTVIGSANWAINQHWNLFAKGGYDVNKAQPADVPPADQYDIFVKPGVEYHYYGIGAEFFPLKNSRNIRLHTFFAVQNAGVNQYHFNIGLTWRLDFLKGIDRLVDRIQNKKNNQKQ